MTTPPNWTLVLGGVILTCVVAYFAFQALDTTGLETQAGIAVVTGKEYRPVERSYRTDKIGNQTRVIPQVTPERYIVKLQIGDRETAGVIDRELFNSVATGDRLSVTYQRRRFTGGLQIVSVGRREQ